VVDDRPITRRSKIAILDSGVDLGHPCFQDAVQGGRVVTKSFVHGLSGNDDADGHGTHTAHLALRVAPNSKLFLARIFEKGTELEFDANIKAVADVCMIQCGPEILSHQSYRLSTGQ
jgi:hypothetical protein